MLLAGVSGGDGVAPDRRLRQHVQVHPEGRLQHRQHAAHPGQGRDRGRNGGKHGAGHDQTAGRAQQTAARSSHGWQPLTSFTQYDINTLKHQLSAPRFTAKKTVLFSSRFIVSYNFLSPLKI